MITVQITYAHGLVKTYFANPEAELGSFVAAVRRFGRIRSVRFGSDVDLSTAREMVAGGQGSILLASAK